MRIKEKTEYVRNNKGMSLVTVIITIGFVSILVSILLMVSMINFKMKKINANAKDSFYSAEQVLDEINLGLQKDISDALSSAYTDILVKYNDEETERKNKKLQTKYYEYLWGKLETDSTHTTYSTDTLYAYLKSSTQWRGGDEDGYGAILRATDSVGNIGTKGGMVTYENSGIVLKNLTVYYKDKKGIVSEIKTDIRLSYPNFDFASSTVIPDVPEYAFITDGDMEVTSSGGGEVAINGNVYADSLTVSAANSNSKMKFIHQGKGEFVVKHALNLKNASFEKNDGEFWANDVIADNSDLSLLGINNVANDLNVKGDLSNIELGGTYNGFGNSLTDPDKSSAILINGTNATLDLSKITKFTLAGHAYIGTTAGKVGSVDGDAVNQGNDVYTGESIAVKSNQLMYMVPPDCIAVALTSGKSLYNKNPLTAAEYNFITKYPNIIKEVSTDVVANSLGENLSTYMKTLNGVAQPEKVFIKTTDPSQTLVYYYMKFSDEDAANKFFAKKYSTDKESIDHYLSFYVKGITFPKNDSLLRLKLAGNAISGSIDKGYENNLTAISNASDKLAKNTKSEEESFTALCTKLIKQYSELANLTKKPDAKNKVIFDNIINVSKFDEYIEKSPYRMGNTITISEEINNKNAVAVLTKDDYTVTDGNVHLVIAKGDVNVNVANFTGTIISGGKITITGSVKQAKAGGDVVKSMMHFSQTYDATVYPIGSVFKDGSDLMYSSLSNGEESQSVVLSDLVAYENWTKE